MNKGEHLRVNRGIYHHHGIYIGDGQVIHFYGEYLEKFQAEVKISSLEEFAKNDALEVVKYQHSKSIDWTIEKAYTLMGSKNYSLMFNNCKHFATLCKTGLKHTRPVDYIPVEQLNWNLIPVPVSNSNNKLKQLLNRIRR